ncbi:MAG TPA: peptidase M18 [Blastocatellia bacterium]|nr:peptidase M18 [Blastocatellia bacterium]
MKRLVVVIVVMLLASVTLSAQEREQGVWAAKKSGWQLLTASQRQEVFKYADGFKSYLRVARSALSSNREFIRMAREAGFQDFTNPSQVKPGAKLIFNNRDRALILTVVGSDPVEDVMHVVAAHQDSPHIDLKARPLYPAAGFVLFKTIYYGGIKKYQWANVPLALIGRIDTTDGRKVDVSIGLNPGDPVFVIPDNAPHSDKPLRTRSYTDVFEGEELDPVAGSMPDQNSSVVAELMQELKARYNITEEDLVSAELQLVPASEPADVGLDRALVGAYGQDDRLSSYCAVRAILSLGAAPKQTALAYLSNFEEVGSVNNTGAASEFLNSTIAQLIGAERGSAYSGLDLRRGLRNAQVISADTNDGINPIFPMTSEPSNSARLGYGVAIKAYGRGFSANSEFTAHIRAILEKNSIPWQTQTPKVDVGGGGTIGGFMSQQDMEVIDLGVPLLSMHATFEMSSKVDEWNFYRLMSAFYQSE